MHLIQTTDAPTPGGHYAQAVVHNGLVYVSGILPITPSGQKLHEAPLDEQVSQVLQNLEGILRAAGSEPSKVLKTTVYVSDISLWGRVNELYAAFFGEHRPARSVVPTGPLHYGVALELEAVAVVG